MGTASLATRTTPSVTPDFTFAGGIPRTCGMVCWGASVDPVTSFAKDPATWSASEPNNYVDCVAYGPYTGPQRTGAGPPASATPGDGIHSLDRVTNASNDFALACPTPTSNGPPGGAEVTGTFGPCAPPTTTTTVTTTTSFTTTSSTTPTTTTSTTPTSTTSTSTTTTTSSTSTTSTTATTSSTTTTSSTATTTVPTTTTSLTTTTTGQPTTTTSTTTTTTTSFTSTTVAN